MNSNTQRFILWAIFGFSLIFLWDGWLKHTGQPSMFGPQTGQTQTQQGKAGTPPAAPGVGLSQPAVTGTASAATPGAANPAAPAATEFKGEVLTLANDVLKLSINTKGGVVERAELLQHKADRSLKENFVLLSNEPGKPYVAESGLLLAGSEVPTHLSAFTVVPGTPANVLSLTAEQGGLRLTRTYTLEPGSYSIKQRLTVENLRAEPVVPAVYSHLRRHGDKVSAGINDYFIHTFTGPAMYTEADKFQKIPFEDIAKGKASHSKSGNNGWVSMIQHYFVSAWVPPQGLERNYYADKDPNGLGYRIGYLANLPSVAPAGKVEHEAVLLIGPQDQQMLKKVAPGLDLVVDYSWLTVIAKPMYYLLLWLHGIFGNWGWAIIFLTVIIKAIFYFPMATAYKSMAKMKQVTPRMMALREKYGDDKMKLNQAMMELYKTEKINPLGGCLPILITIPVFLALYWVLLGSVEMRHAPWLLWVKDLSTPDPWYILPIVLAVTMWAQFKLNPTPPDPMQARILMIMQAVFAVMFLFFPSGLVLYYIVNNVLSIAQQWWIYRQLEKQGYKMR
ncbi:membrane protein insertase YidC [Piscinibacterium candidicorallinum]|jgi:YidC/Oxa1 family membrane protein insertase|uniref:Membrane protein insertase YidC n=1 Tax=Piscinibacterium candidicorallinum TaxID=1793872 RepID=A0ABV7HB47_9BURK